MIGLASTLAQSGNCKYPAQLENLFETGRLAGSGHS